MEESRVEASANPETCQKPGFEVGTLFRMDSWIFYILFFVDLLFWVVWQIWLKICPGNRLAAAGAESITPSIKKLSKNPSRQA